MCVRACFDFPTKKKGLRWPGRRRASNIFFAKGITETHLFHFGYAPEKKDVRESSEFVFLYMYIMLRAEKKGTRMKYIRTPFGSIIRHITMIFLIWTSIITPPKFLRKHTHI